MTDLELIKQRIDELERLSESPTLSGREICKLLRERIELLKEYQFRKRENENRIVEIETCIRSIAKNAPNWKFYSLTNRHKSNKFSCKKCCRIYLLQKCSR